MNQNILCVTCAKINIHTCNHRSENHCYGDEISFRKQVPEFVVDKTAPVDYLKEDKRNCHTHKPSVLYYQPLVPWSIGVELCEGLGLSVRKSLT